jgi:hypothetical protein
MHRRRSSSSCRLRRRVFFDSRAVRACPAPRWRVKGVTSTRPTASGRCDTLSQLLPDCRSTRDIPLAEPSWRESAEPWKRRLPYAQANFSELNSDSPSHRYATNGPFFATL